MNKLQQIYRSITFHFIIATLIVLLSIWLIGPYVKLMGYNPLANWAPRLIPTCIIIVIWVNYALIKFILRGSQFNPTREQPKEERKTLLEHTVINDLQRDFLQTLQSSQKSLPWFLLIGPQASGKTTFLSQMPFEFHSPREISLKQVKATQWVDWWYCESAVFIDPAGKYALAQTDEPSEQIVWRGLINILKKNRRRAPIKGILLIIDVTTLCFTNNPIFNNLLDNLIYQIQMLKNLQQALTVDIIISQTDRIVGFNEFFDDLSSKERKQPFGFSITYSKTDLASQVEKKFDEFIKNLSARSLWRLHHEHSVYKRSKIQQFPLQMEKLGQRLKTLANQLPWNTQLQLNGIYFISNVQHHAPLDLLQNAVGKQTFGLQQYPQTLMHYDSQNYFIDELCHNIIVHAQNRLYQQPIVTTRQQLVYLCAIVLISGLTLIWHNNYQRDLAVMSTIFTTLHEHSRAQVNSLTLPWLNQLNKLSDTINMLESKQNNVAKLAGLNQGQHLLTAMQDRYQLALRSHVLPYLVDELSTALEQNQHNNAAMTLYNALKVYLMLTREEQVDPQFINTWFDQYWQQQYPDDALLRNQLNTHLEHLLQLKNIKSVGNEVLVAEVQNELQGLPLVNQAFLKLQEYYSLKSLPILADLPTIDNIDLSQATVCSFCTVTNFEQVYSKQIPAIVNTMNQANWILETPEKIPLSSMQQQVLIKELRELYLDYYKKQWADTLHNIRILPAKTLAQAQQNIDLLRNPASQFWKLLRIVENNITLNQFADNSAANQDPMVNDLVNLLNSDSELYQQTKYNLDQLSDYLFHINETTGTDHASYLAAVNRFTHHDDKDPISIVLAQGQQAPLLMKPWLQVIGQGAWHAILVNTRQYLNTIWSTVITPEYQQHVINHFPIFINANDYISIDNFTHFFGPGGALEDFFTQYVQPFVNMNGNYWNFKILDDESINIPQQALDMFIRASMIQQMFFTDNHQQPSINFSLIPMRLGDTTSGFTLNLGSQVVQFTEEQHNDQTLYWPPRDALFATVLFNGTDNQNPSLTLSGPWAFFKLLQSANIQSTKNAQEYQVTFQLQHYSAQYLLIAHHLVNPFIPGILDKFRCPALL